MNKILALLLLSTSLNAFAQENTEEKKSSLWITPGMVSLHFDRNQGFNEKNFGIGLEYQIDNEWSIAGGRFRNSENGNSNYITAAYQPIDFFGLKTGLAVGVMDGYMGPNNKFDGKPFLMAVPVMTYEAKNYGVNILFVPQVKNNDAVLYGALGFQLKIKAF